MSTRTVVGGIRNRGRHTLGEWSAEVSPSISPACNHADPPDRFRRGKNLYRKLAYNLRLPGQVFDWQAGLPQNGSGDYDPATGRYVQSDPVGLGGGINTYAYAAGNP